MMVEVPAQTPVPGGVLRVVETGRIRQIIIFNIELIVSVRLRVHCHYTR